MIDFPKDKALILFDGVCNLCHKSVIFVIKHDKKDKFRFAPLQSHIGQQLTHQFDIDTSKTDSIIMYHPEKGVSSRSTAALKIAKHLRFPINLLTIFLIFPPFIRNWFYDYVARNRYKWYGKKDNCMVPTPELQSKFLQ